MTNTLQVNVELLQETLTYIKNHPEEWDQKAWSQYLECGTSYCFAGHAARLANGGTLPWNAWDGEGGRLDPERTRFGEEYIQEEARIALGLSDEQADILFSKHNSLKQLKFIVQNLTSEDDGDE